VKDTTGEEGMKYFPLIFTLFVFILVLNLLGMINIPGLVHPFTVTSHIIVTFALAALVFLTVTIIGFMKHGFGYLRLFVPSGVPMWLMPILVPIEVISYLIRPISLSVRLFANMMAGHTLLKVLAGFATAFVSAGGLTLLAVPVMVVVLIAFTGLEVLVACLQAFVFAVLSCIYLNDALHMHDHH
jgi:F-type H+-transporting ATPase subunit a